MIILFYNLIYFKMGLKLQKNNYFIKYLKMLVGKLKLISAKWSNVRRHRNIQ